MRGCSFLIRLLIISVASALRPIQVPGTPTTPRVQFGEGGFFGPLPVWPASPPLFLFKPIGKILDMHSFLSNVYTPFLELPLAESGGTQLGKTPEFHSKKNGFAVPQFSLSVTAKPCG